MKVLVLRFSSIGDIVLTSPVLRCLSRQVPGIEVHFVTKKKFRELLDFNPYVRKVHVLDDSMAELAAELEKEKFDLVIDLHNNIRTRRLKLALGVRSNTFHKLNWRKWVLVNLKFNALPDEHIVKRYLNTCLNLGVKYDGEGLDFFYDPATSLPEEIKSKTGADYDVYAIGGTYTTKKLPVAKMRELFEKTQRKLILIGDNLDKAVADEAIRGFEERVVNLCGQLSIAQSALLIREAKTLLTHDTGMMHVGAALKKKTISIWGNTIPLFGMWALFPDALQAQNDIRFEVDNLSCRPCSKLGHVTCPKGHFHCMNLQDTARIAEKLG